MNNAPVEPSADLRLMANMLHQTYTALVQEGFTAPEAIQIIGHMIANAPGATDA